MITCIEYVLLLFTNWSSLVLSPVCVQLIKILQQPSERDLNYTYSVVNIVYTRYSAVGLFVILSKLMMVVMALLMINRSSQLLASFSPSSFIPLLDIVSAARSLTCRDDLDSKWRLLLAENELSHVSLLSSISIGN